MDKDTIYRQQAIDAMCAVCGDDCDKSEFVYNAPQDEQVILCPEHYVLTQLPSAQPEVIRCKDCKDYQTDWETSYPNRHYCATMDSFMPEDGFCNYAERREDE